MFLSHGYKVVVSRKVWYSTLLGVTYVDDLSHNFIRLTTCPGLLVFVGEVYKYHNWNSVVHCNKVHNKTNSNSESHLSKRVTQ